jgi:hypothetical protein
MSNNDFKPIETPWGVMYLHHSREVWYTHFDYDPRGKKKDCWMAYRTSRDWPSETPWCQDGTREGDSMGYPTEEEAKTACLARYNKMALIKSGKFIYT